MTESVCIPESHDRLFTLCTEHREDENLCRFIPKTAHPQPATKKQKQMLFLLTVTPKTSLYHHIAFVWGKNSIVIANKVCSCFVS